MMIICLKKRRFIYFFANVPANFKAGLIKCSKFWRDLQIGSRLTAAIMRICGAGWGRNDEPGAHWPGQVFNILCGYLACGYWACVPQAGRLAAAKKALAVAGD